MISAGHGRTGLAPQHFRVAPEDAGTRLDLFLTHRLGVSRAEARRLLEQGAVRSESRRLRRADKGLRLAAGQGIEVEEAIPPHERRPLPQPELLLAVLAQGRGWLALDKPAGSPVHPLREDERGTLLNALIARHPEVFGVGEGGLRSGVVHRLDVDTSGVLLFALERAAWSRLREAFRRHRVEKVYRTLVEGRLRGEGRERLELRVAQHRPARVRVRRGEEGDRAGGRKAELRWRALETFAGATLVEVRPRTGFLHQIRATLAHLGHPVLGDRTYGTPAGGQGPARHLLHAAGIRFAEIEVESPDPPDFCAVLDRLRNG